MTMNNESFTDSQLEERIAYFGELITQERLSRVTEVLKQRTRHVSVVLEDIFQPHNASAVLRSCDGFGVQDVHIIENKNNFHLNKSIELGTSQWLTINRHRESNTNNTVEAIKKLKSDGYRIIATSPHNNDVNLEDLDVTKGKMALMFGTELTGLSDTALDLADEYMKIPMYGFVESFNISVSCAMTLHHITHALRTSEVDLSLSERERLELLYDWIRNSIKRPELHDKHFA